jgi:AAA+ superfamily predicted ATPase
MDKASPSSTSKAKPNKLDTRNISDMLMKLWRSERTEPKAIKIMAFFVLSALGLSWIPFYPFWMVLTLSFICAAISHRFPYISLLLLGIFVSASASYQTPEFGFFMLAFSLLILVASLFDWKFGFLVFAAIFVSKFGLSFVIPIVGIMLFNSFLGITVGAVSGMALIFFVTCGNLDVSSFIVGAQQTTGFIIFSNPVKPDFIPTDMGGALVSIGDANGGVMADVIGANLGSSIVPFIQVIVWCASFYIVSFARNRNQIGNSNAVRDSWILIPLLAAVLILVSFLIAYPALGYRLTIPIVLVSLGIIPVVVATTAFCMIIRRDFKDIFARAPDALSAMRIGGSKDIRRTTFENVGGLDEIKEEVKDSIFVPLLRKELAEHYSVNLPKGILLFGPPGCGKTLIMKAMAGELEIEMFHVRCSDLMSKWYGESEGKIEELFKLARERKPSIIFLDDIDTIARSRDMYAADDVTPRLLGMILSELDGMTPGSEMIIVGSTNKPEILDSALMRPGRFDKIIYIPPPDLEGRKDILRIHLKGKPVKGIDIDEMARRMEGFSGADIANVVNEVAVMAMKKALRTGKTRNISMKDFDVVLRSVKPSITDSLLDDYLKYRQQFERKMLRSVKRDKVYEKGRNKRKDRDGKNETASDGHIAKDHGNDRTSRMEEEAAEEHGGNES